MAEAENRISAVVIARNEEKRVGTCLASLAWADERIVIDNESTDGTAAQSRNAGARIYRGTGDFSKLRDLGREKATGDWILYVDADETVSEELAAEIRKTVKMDDKTSAYRIKRRNTYLGQVWPYTERIPRLFRKRALTGWHGPVHESPDIRGTVGDLSGTLLHDTHRSLQEMVDKTNEWSETEAKLRFDAGHPHVTWWRFFRVMLTGFWNSYLSQGGWRAGPVGIIESIYQAFSMFVTYAKLWELQEGHAGHEG